MSDLRKVTIILDLPNIIDPNKPKLTASEYKKLAKEAVTNDCERKLKEQIKRTKKLKDGPMIEEKFNKKEYITNLLPTNAR